MDPVSGFFWKKKDGGAATPAAMELLASRPGSPFEVWRGSRHGRFRVFKCLKEEFRGQELYEQMLFHDFSIGYSLRHPGIAEYYDFIKLPDYGSTIEMEWVDGRPIPEGRSRLSAKWAKEICSAVEYLHARGVYHKDLKPSNILVTYAGDSVKLIDFGLSDAPDSVVRLHGGTEGYCAPELLKEGAKADARSDIYSLGKILAGLGYARAGRKCCQEDPEKRPQSVADVEALLTRRLPVWPFVVAAVLVIAAAYALWPKDSAEAPYQESPVAVEEVEPEVVPEPESAPVVKPAPKPAEEPSSAPANLDDLFQEATGLFENL